MNRNINLPALISLACAVWFAISTIIIHIIRSDLDFIEVALSVYAIGNGGMVLESGFYSIGLSQLLIAGILFVQADVKKIAVLSILLAGSGVIIVGIFPTYIEPVDIVIRLPHIAGATMQFLFFPLALLLLNRNMSAGSFRRYTVTTGVFTAIMFFLILLLFIVSQSVEIGFFGLVEKLNIVAINAWLLFMSWKLTRVLDESPVFCKMPVVR